MHLRLISGFVFAIAIAFACAVATAASDGQGQLNQGQIKQPTKSKTAQAEKKQDPKSTVAQGEKEKKPVDEPKGNLDRLELQKLEEVLAHQRRLLERLDSLEGTTLPNAFHGVHSSILDALANLELQVLDAIGGLQQQCTTADLLPLPAPGTTGPLGFCQFTDDNKLLVRIHNQGGVAAAASTTRVSFFGGVVTDQATPALAAFGGGVSLAFDVPESCYGNIAGDSECNFTIAADIANVVVESNEANNVAAGRCIRIG